MSSSDSPLDGSRADWLLEDDNFCLGPGPGPRSGQGSRQVSSATPYSNPHPQQYQEQQQHQDEHQLQQHYQQQQPHQQPQQFQHPHPHPHPHQQPHQHQQPHRQSPQQQQQQQQQQPQHASSSSSQAPEQYPSAAYDSFFPIPTALTQIPISLGQPPGNYGDDGGFMRSGLSLGITDYDRDQDQNQNQDYRPDHYPGLECNLDSQLEPPPLESSVDVVQFSDYQQKQEPHPIIPASVPISMHMSSGSFTQPVVDVGVLPAGYGLPVSVPFISQGDSGADALSKRFLSPSSIYPNPPASGIQTDPLPPIEFVEPPLNSNSIPNSTIKLEPHPRPDYSRSVSQTSDACFAALSASISPIYSSPSATLSPSSIPQAHTPQSLTNTQSPLSIPSNPSSNSSIKSESARQHISTPKRKVVSRHLDPHPHPHQRPYDRTALSFSKSPLSSSSPDESKRSTSEGLGDEPKPFVACTKCRQRKVRCDGSKPKCVNCVKKCLECCYDQVVKRRGPDKEPGARSKKREDLKQVVFRPRETENGIVTSTSSGEPPLSQLQLNSVFEQLCHAAPIKPAKRVVKCETPSDRSVNISLERLPNSEYARHSDWAWIAGLLSPVKAEGLQMLEREMRYFFDLNFLWFSCFNRSLFFTRMHRPDAYMNLQPALVLSMLAVTTLLKTWNSSIEECTLERSNAITFAEAARSMIHQSIAAQSVDQTLAHAALVLAVFECCPHPQHSRQRFVEAIKLMDAIIQTFQLLSMDVHDPRTSIFVEGVVPSPDALVTVTASSPPSLRPPDVDSDIPETGDASAIRRWAPSPYWPVEWSFATIAQDECRRMCWTASTLAASCLTWQHTIGEAPAKLYLGAPENYALFFPAEVLLLDVDPRAGKVTLWALYQRVVLLWHFVVRISTQPLSDERKREIAAQIWHEASKIERCLFNVVMDGGDLQKWQARDYVVGLRMMVLKKFCPPRVNQSPGEVTEVIPGVPMDKRTLFQHTAAQWLESQAQVGKVMRSSVAGGHPGNGPSLKTRPFFIWFLFRQLNTALEIYAIDPSNGQALQLANSVLKIISVIASAWPCSSVNKRWAEFRALYSRVVERALAIQGQGQGQAVTTGQ